MSLVKPELDYLVRSFHPGYMDSPEPDTVPVGGTPDARNCLFGALQLYPAPRVTLEKRSGARLLTPAQVVSGKGFDGLFEFWKVGQTTGVLMAAIDGKVWRWDNVSAFVQIGATAPFASGTKVGFFIFRNLLFVTDGTTTRCWDGVIGNDLFTPGEIAPTAAGALTTAAGPGVTGTYEGFQVWYDSTHDHETSPSPLTAQVVFANQTRTWAKPSGAPGANYNKWRVYCRRVDTNETYYKRVAEVAIATVTTTETTTDAARNLATLGPLPQTNDSPPLNFAFQAEFQGYRLGVLTNDDQVYVSKILDPQSQHPKDILGVARGTGGELRSLKKFGAELVAQKASKTYRLKGDRMPFVPDEVHSAYGNVGATSAVEVKGKLFAWDNDKGPYWTDLQTHWVPLGTARIQETIAAVSKVDARNIECIYSNPLNLVIWSIPNGVSVRRRTLLAYHVELDAWLPPITGLEYAAITTFTDINGSQEFYVGDYWGRLFKYFVDYVEGVPSGTLRGRVSAASSGTVTIDLDNDTLAAPALYTTGNGLTGVPVVHLNAAGDKQWRRIQSNTPTVITLDTTNDAAWNQTPVAGDEIAVGGIDWYWRAPIIDYGEPFRKKKGGFFAVQARPGSSAFALRMVGLMEGFSTVGFRRTFSFTSASSWGVGSWGTMLWGGGEAQGLKTRLMRTFFGFTFELSNPYPNQPVAVLSLRVGADPIGAWVSSGGS